MAGRLFIIRCDSSAKIGSGHVMRCLNLARMLFIKRGARIHFLCRDLMGNSNDYIRASGFDLTVMKNHSGTDGFQLLEDNDSAETVDLIRNLSAHTVIVDHYGAGERWQAAVRPFAKLAVIDDLADHPHQCDILINQNLYAEGSELYSSLINDDATLLMGPRYAMIAPIYSDSRPAAIPFEDTIKRIIIFFGASDLPNMTGMCIEAVMKMKQIPETVDVVIGKNHPEKDKLKAAAAKCSNIKFFDFIENFPDFLSGADLMIGAGGTTQWERCCLGIPGIIISIADNQDKLAQNLADIHSALYLGRHESMTVDIIKNSLDDLSENPGSRRKMAGTSYALVDGKGTIRVADELMRYPITLRLAEASDAERLHLWRNHPEIRKASHDESEINFNSHKIWLDKTLKNTSKTLLIAEVEHKPLGVLRFDFNDKTAIISLYIVPHLIGQGHGSALLKTGYNWLRTNKPDITVVRASIKKNNDRSKKIFLAAGYKPFEDFFELKVSR